jgi:amino acid transporter
MSKSPALDGYDDGMELAPYHQGIEVNDDYQGMEVHQYPGGADDGSEKQAFHEDVNIYDEDPHSRLRRDLKTRQIAMIALGGALGTGLLIQTWVPGPRVSYIRSFP